MKTARVITAIGAMILSFAFVLNVFAGASTTDTPLSLKGGKVVEASEVKSLIASKGAVFFDTRSAVNFGKGHIPGAVMLSYKGKSPNVPDVVPAADEMDVSKLPADKNAKIVFYSDGPKGWKSYKAALIAIIAGYKNVLWYRNGFEEWQNKGYPVE